VVEFKARWRHYLSQGKRFLRSGQFSRALAYFEKALALAPQEPQVLLAVGRERLRQGRWDESEKLLRQALVFQPENAMAAAALARVLGMHLARLPEAFKVIEQGIANSSNPMPLHVIRGELLLEEHRHVEAREAFLLAQHDRISGTAARLGLARSYNLEGIALSEQGAYEPAMFALKRATDLDAQWSSPWVNLGVVFGRMSMPSKALEAYTTALERDPLNPVGYFNLGTVHHELGHLEEACVAYEELLDLAPDYPHVRGALANVLGEMKDYDRAIALFLEELDTDTRCVSCWSSLGLAYLCTGDVERSEQCLVRALEIDPTYFKAIHSLATFYLAQRRLEEAEAVLLKALRLDPAQTAKIAAAEKQLAQLRGLPETRRLSSD
jgi:tetratricopeptide (TPR) repeat protein